MPLSTLLALLAAPALASVPRPIELDAGPDLETRLKTALIQAPPGTLIQLPEGKYAFSDEVIVSKPGITLRGHGMGKTVLSFKAQKAGPQGILAHGNGFTAEDLAVEDTPGDGIKAAGVNGVTFRRVRVEWTGKPRRENGGYGLYPVSSRNVLIEDCAVRGASDSGIYVGQSENIVVRRNRAWQNVAGIEIENSRYADVMDNEITGNASGILVFDLPDLPRQGGRQTRVFNNVVRRNNHRNFSAKGNILNLVPPGTGILVVANDDVEIFGNRIEKHKLTSIGIANFAVSERPVTDPRYDPRPERIHVHHNRIDQHRLSFFDGSPLNTVANLLFALRVPEILYDGIEDGTYEGQPPGPEQRICIHDNVNARGKTATFGNMHLDHQRKLVPWPGGPVSRSLKPHDCSYPALPAIALEDPLPLPPADEPPPPEEVARLCSSNASGPGTGVNWAALEVDCPRLSDYRLFKNPEDPTSGPSPGGTPYDLTVPLFSDHAGKHRFVFLPPGTSASYRPDAVFDFPMGTIITKTFSFPDARLVETRLLIRRARGWAAVPYVWSADQRDAELSLAGEVRVIGKAHYNVPGQAKCAFCHGDTLAPIGLKAGLLNHGGQLERWRDARLLSGLPAEPSAWPLLPKRDARAYLDVNCAHCHNPLGRARNSGLFLEYKRDPGSTAYGVCKPPVAAGQGSGGRLHAIVPGSAKKSIVSFRMASNHLAVRMPEEGRSIVDAEGLRLVDEWIDGLPGRKCR